MKRSTVGELLFWCAAELAGALYFLSAPDGLPWNTAPGGRIFRYLVAMANGSEVMLSGTMAAVACGLLAAVANRYLGWRIGAAAAVVWMFSPWVWNQAVTGGRGVCAASVAVAVVWAANALLLPFALKIRNRHGEQRKALALAVNISVSSGHDPAAARIRVNRLASLAALGAATLFAVVSASMHDYRLGEAASAYARLIVAEAGDRLILANGLCDRQLVREAKTGQLVERYGEPLAALVRREWPDATNLMVAARIGFAAFADAAVRTFPSRFYVMTGLSTTPERWSERWSAMKPYLASDDPFVAAMRRAFAYEGNFLGNELQERGDLKMAWQLYLRIFDEIDLGNPAACVNLSGMLRRGYRTDGLTRDRIESAQADFTKHMTDRRKAMRIAERVVRFGPVMRDETAYEEACRRIAARLEELRRKGEGVEPSEELKTLVERNADMMKAFYGQDFERCAHLARTILSQPRWRGFIPAHMVMGVEMARHGDYVAAEAFYRVAVSGKGAAAPSPFVCNDYADVLRHLKRYDDAERYARKAVGETDAKKGWLFRITLAQVLMERHGGGDVAGEIESLLKEAKKHASAAAVEMIRKEFGR